ncbi:MAG: methyl-accepting chemotaxis protein [Planctomycetaceae bacterium]|nr:methyl-accepting chemotaxis protein [Planctomycetaceae bacterium]
MKIKTKLTLGFTVLLVFLIAVGIVGYIALSSADQGLDNVLMRVSVSQQISDATSEVFLAQISAMELAATRDVNYADSVPRHINRALEMAAAAEANTRRQENKDIINRFMNLIREYGGVVEEYKQLQIEIDRLTAETTIAANNVDTMLQALVADVLSTYEGMVEAGETMTIQQIRSYGGVVGLIEITGQMRVYRRDYIMAMADPRRTAAQEAARQAFNDSAENYYVQARQVQDMFLLEATRERVAGTIGLIRTWAETSNSVKDLMTLQAQRNVRLFELTNMLEAESATLGDNVDDMIDDEQQLVKRTVASSSWLIFGMTGLAVLSGVGFAFLLTTNITSGINFVVKTMTKVVDKGDLSVKVDAAYLNRQDEIGSLVKELNAVLKDYSTIDGMANALAAGDWQMSISAKSDLDTMNINLDKMIGQVNGVLRQINDAVEKITTGAGGLSAASNSLASGTQESAASIEEISATMHQISSQTKGNADNADQASGLAKQAMHATVDGQETMQQMNEAMKQITKNSEEVQRVVKVIDDIAFQTNLLALNAAVEAARAGTHGKGFAVVAEEVRNLAARSAKAARETSELIGKSGHEIEKGAEVASHTSEVLDTIVEQVKQMTELIGSIAIASNEQASGVNQVSSGLQQIDQVTQQNTASAEESAGVANEMNSLARNLQELVGQFKLRQN